MKKVFHIISHFDVGGAERVAVNIAMSPEKDIEYHVVELIRASSPFTSVFMKELDEAGIRCHRAHVPDVHFHYLFERLAALAFPLWFLPVFLRHRPDVIHSHTEMPDFAVFLFFRLFPPLLRRCRVVRTIHNTCLWTGMKATGRLVERFFIKRHSNVAISESVRDSYMREYRSTTPIIYNGVEKARQKPYPGIIYGKSNILFAGRLEPQKGISTLTGIIKKLAGDSRYRFHVIGDGSMRQYVTHELSGLDNVTLSPPVHGLSGYLSSFSYLLMPSEFEGLSIMSIEAGMARLPVIASDAPGLRDTLPDDWPLKVPDNSADGYVRIFKDIIPQSDRDALGRISRSFAERHFSVRRMQEQYEKIYFGKEGCQN